jgi:hypothetical protein
MPTMTELRKQAVAGLVPPQVDEAIIRVAWPSVAAFPPAAGLGRVLMRSMVLAPLGWLLLAPIYFKKIVPYLGSRYTLTNRRVLIQRGPKLRGSEASLADIDEVRVVSDANSDFYRAATLEILSRGKVILTLPGVPSPEAFRVAVLNAAKAWGPILQRPADAAATSPV